MGRWLYGRELAAHRSPPIGAFLVSVFASLRRAGHRLPVARPSGRREARRRWHAPFHLEDGEPVAPSPQAVRGRGTARSHRFPQHGRDLSRRRAVGRSPARPPQGSVPGPRWTESIRPGSTRRPRRIHRGLPPSTHEVDPCRTPEGLEFRTRSARLQRVRRHDSVGSYPWPWKVAALPAGCNGPPWV
jgi:hypothetical protein